MLALDTHFVPGLVMFIRNCFRPSNGLSEPTGSISITLKSREQGTSSPPCARSAEYFLRPVTVHSIVATSRCKNSELRCHCPMIVPFSQPQRINRKHFRGLFHTPTLQPPPPILLYIRGSLECNISFRKTLPWQLLSLYISSPCSSYAITNAML